MQKLVFICLFLLNTLSVYAQNLQIDDQRLIFKDGPPIYKNNSLEMHSSNFLHDMVVKLFRIEGNTMQSHLAPQHTGNYLAKKKIYEDLLENRVNAIYVRDSDNYIRSITIPNPTSAAGTYVNTIAGFANEKASAYVVIASLDTGVDLDHNHLRGKLLADFGNHLIQWDGNQVIFDPRTKRMKLYTPPTRPIIGYGIDYIGYDQGVGGYPLRKDDGTYDVSETGYDFGIIYKYVNIGNERRDRWPYPYIIRTNLHNDVLVQPENVFNLVYSQLLPPQLANNMNNRMKMAKLLQVIMLNDDFKSREYNLDVTHLNYTQIQRDMFWDMFHPSRNTELEIESLIGHGTHIAGILVNGNSLLNKQNQIIDAKVLPFRIALKNYAEANEEHSSTLAFNYKRAFAEAAARNTKIVNLSLISTDNKVSKVIEDAIKYYKDMVFVVAAGNFPGDPLNDKNKVLPCSLNLPNLVCVGALDTNLRTLVPYTNYASASFKGNFVYALGKDVKSAHPRHFCDSEELRSYLDGSSDVPNIFSRDEYDKYLYGEQIRKNLNEYLIDEEYNIYDVIKSCEPYLTYAPTKTLSGTSQAAAMVSRAIAKMMIDRRLMMDNEKSNGGPKVFKASDEMKSWSGESILKHFLNTKNSYTELVQINGIKSLKIRHVPMQEAK